MEEKILVHLAINKETQGQSVRAIRNRGVGRQSPARRFPTGNRLAPYFGLATGRFLTVPDPKRAVLLEAPRQFTAVRIWLTEP